MAFSYRRLFFGGTTFCCCLPVRLGVIVMSSLGCLVAGILMIILWFELSGALCSSVGFEGILTAICLFQIVTLYMTTQERVAFILAALTETVMFAASILGLVSGLSLNFLS